MSAHGLTNKFRREPLDLVAAAPAALISEAKEMKAIVEKATIAAE